MQILRSDSLMLSSFQWKRQAPSNVPADDRTPAHQSGGEAQDVTLRCDNRHCQPNFSRFLYSALLAACTRLITTLSVSPYVGPCVLPFSFYSHARDSIRQDVGRSVITSRFQTLKAERRADLSYCHCPCQAGILPQPTRT